MGLGETQGEARPSSWLSLAGPSQAHALGPDPSSAPPQGPLSWVLSPAVILLQGPSLGSPVGGNRNTPCYNNIIMLKKHSNKMIPNYILLLP